MGSARSLGNEGRTIRTLIVDDDPAVCLLVRSLLEGMVGLEVVCSTGESHHGLLLAKCLRPDLVVLDLHMPNMSGFELTPLLAKHCPQTRIIILTSDERPGLPQECFTLGAHGFVNKSHMMHALPTEIQRLFTSSPGA